MKKFLYYVMPFIVTPALIIMGGVVGCNWLLWSVYLWGAVFIITSAVLGFFTSTNKKFDYLMTFLMPLSFFVSMFALGFFGKWDNSRFHLGAGLRVSTQQFVLILYCLMAIVTFIASYKGFRRFKDRIIKTDSGKILTFKISSIIVTVLGSTILILNILVPIVMLVFGSSQDKVSIGIIGGADVSLLSTIVFTADLLNRIILGVTLLLIGVLGLIFRKSIFENSTKKRSLLTLSTSFFGGLGLASLFFWFFTAATNRIRFSPIGYPTSIVVGFLSLFAVIISIVLYFKEQKKNLKIKGIIIDVLATVITFPIFAMTCFSIASFI